MSTRECFLQCAHLSKFQVKAGQVPKLRVTGAIWPDLRGKEEAKSTKDDSPCDEASREATPSITARPAQMPQDSRLAYHVIILIDSICKIRLVYFPDVHEGLPDLQGP